MRSWQRSTSTEKNGADSRHDNKVHRIVLDTNVLVSSVISDGNPRRLVQKSILYKQYVLISSRRLIDEIKKVLGRQKFNIEWNLLAFLKPGLIEIVDVKSEFKAVPDDPDDNIVINAAYDGRADYIVSGDRRLLKMKEFAGIPIVTVARMLDILETPA